MSSRKNVLLAGSLAALLIVGICASLFVSAANHMTFPSASSQAASDPDDLDAWNAFAFLVHATDEYKDQKPAPAWVDWANKC